MPPLSLKNVFLYMYGDDEDTINEGRELATGGISIHHNPLVQFTFVPGTCINYSKN